MQTPTPDPNHGGFLIQFLTYAWVVVVSMFGGLVSFIRRRNATTPKVPMKEQLGILFGELAISAFAGLITYWLCQYWGLHSALTAVFIAVSGHLGGKSIDAVARIWLGVIDKGNSAP